MSCGGEAGKQWTCAKAGAASLQKVGLIVRDIGEPCLSQSPIKVVITAWVVSYNLSSTFSDRNRYQGPSCPWQLMSPDS
ncbi:small G protein signaling modulator 1 isoform X4 [Cucumis melo var. makuwa]|uniref:Small G protein signaling modulator 1 isoform X4 n=1 Tax=Cucumis melo var. makuwa TaxID=1194695 RepID=A0A5A7TT36_CUCMM|nr:small G protein signaling modulator 1 isoform X4 [Cucumis melo var. makuwa]